MLFFAILPSFTAAPLVGASVEVKCGLTDVGTTWRRGEWALDAAGAPLLPWALCAVVCRPSALAAHGICFVDGAAALAPAQPPPPRPATPSELVRLSPSATVSVRCGLGAAATLYAAGAWLARLDDDGALGRRHRLEGYEICERLCPRYALGARCAVDGVSQRRPAARVPEIVRGSGGQVPLQVVCDSEAVLRAGAATSIGVSSSGAPISAAITLWARGAWEVDENGERLAGYELCRVACAAASGGVRYAAPRCRVDGVVHARPAAAAPVPLRRGDAAAVVDAVDAVTGTVDVVCGVDDRAAAAVAAATLAAVARWRRGTWAADANGRALGGYEICRRVCPSGAAATLEWSGKGCVVDGAWYARPPQPRQLYVTSVAVECPVRVRGRRRRSADAGDGDGDVAVAVAPRWITAGDWLFSKELVGYGACVAACGAPLVDRHRRRAAPLLDPSAWRPASCRVNGIVRRAPRRDAARLPVALRTAVVKAELLDPLAGERCAAGCVHGVCVGNVCRCEPGWSLPRGAATSSGVGGGEQCSVPAACPPGCSSHGECWRGKCLCEAGWAGPACAATTCLRGCSGAGVCQHGVCHCFPGFKGRSCAISNPCPDEQLDLEARGLIAGGAKSGLTSWSWSGSSGGGSAAEHGCSGHGRCAWGRCFCDEQWSGEACSEPSRCPRDCSQRGICTGGRCLCNVGFGGEDCATLVLAAPSRAAGTELVSSPGADRCPFGCGVNGLCLLGKCLCRPGYSGRTCGDGGGAACATEERSDGGCSGHGVCKGVKCFCLPGWIGARCDEQRPCPSDCSGRGVCFVGQCLCAPSFTGTACETPASCPSSCNGRGICHAGRCLCEPGFVGVACGAIGPRAIDDARHRPRGGLLTRAGARGASASRSCNETSASAREGGSGGAHATACSGHGQCSFGHCLCDLGWAGSICDEFQARCANDCWGRGVCVATKIASVDGGGGVKSPLRFAGASLRGGGGRGRRSLLVRSSKKLQQQALLPTLRPVLDWLTARGRCFCNPGFTGADCSTALPCAGEGDAGCGSHGICTHGRCFCEEGFDGAGCERQRSNISELALAVAQRRGAGADSLSVAALRCPNACSMHGICVKGACVCEEGFGGVECSIRFVEFGSAGAKGAVALSAVVVGGVCTTGGCGTHGVCVLGKCICHPGYGGRMCGVRVSVECPVACSGHGVCSYGVCFCDFGFEGMWKMRKRARREWRFVAHSFEVFASLTNSPSLSSLSLLSLSLSPTHTRC